MTKINHTKSAVQNLVDLFNTQFSPATGGGALSAGALTLGIPSVLTPGEGNDEHNTALVVTGVEANNTYGSTTVNYSRLKLAEANPNAGASFDCDLSDNHARIQKLILNDLKLVESEIVFTNPDIPPKAQGAAQSYKLNPIVNSLLYAAEELSVAMTNTSPIPINPQSVTAGSVAIAASFYDEQNDAVYVAQSIGALGGILKFDVTTRVWSSLGNFSVSGSGGGLIASRAAVGRLNSDQLYAVGASLNDSVDYCGYLYTESTGLYSYLTEVPIANGDNSAAGRCLIPGTSGNPDRLFSLYLGIVRILTLTGSTWSSALTDLSATVGVVPVTDAALVYHPELDTVFSFGGNSNGNVTTAVFTNQTVAYAMGSGTPVISIKAPASTGKTKRVAVLMADGRILVAGGYWYSGGLKSVKTVEIYDPFNDTWEVMNDFPAFWFNGSMVLINGYPTTIGGSMGTASLGTDLNGTMYGYRPNADAWDRTWTPTQFFGATLGTSGGRAAFGIADHPLLDFSDGTVNSLQAFINLMNKSNLLVGTVPLTADDFVFGTPTAGGIAGKTGNTLVTFDPAPGSRVAAAGVFLYTRKTASTWPPASIAVTVPVTTAALYPAAAAIAAGLPTDSFTGLAGSNPQPGSAASTRFGFTIPTGNFILTPFSTTTAAVTFTFTADQLFGAPVSVSDGKNVYEIPDVAISTYTSSTSVLAFQNLLQNYAGTVSGWILALTHSGLSGATGKGVPAPLTISGQGGDTGIEIDPATLAWTLAPTILGDPFIIHYVRKSVPFPTDPVAAPGVANMTAAGANVTLFKNAMRVGYQFIADAYTDNGTMDTSVPDTRTMVFTAASSSLLYQPGTYTFTQLGAY